jgi:hypothetical protein
MPRDEIVAAALVLAFAVLVTVHVAIVAGLLARSPRWRALPALIVAPLAPYWAWTAMRRRALVWMASAVAYAVLRAIATS